MTSIEWLINELYTEMNLSGDGRVLDEILEEAKEMHKQEIINAWYNGYINQSPMVDEENCGEQFYKETFVSKGSDECQFEPTTNTSSATICKHCGREKFLHTT